MVEIDVYWFYWASMCTYPLHLAEEGIPLSAAAGHLGIARIALESFGEEAARVFPNTAAKTTELLQCINEMIPQQPPIARDRPVTNYEATKLRNGASAMQTALKDEAKHNYVLCVENQRCLSAHSLIEKIENCFSPESWSVIENDAKKEFEEAGKCLAVERYTASGFHSFRGVECVIRQYLVELTGSLPKKRDWGYYIEILKQNSADVKLLAVLDNIRSLERNPLMHPEDWLDIDDAIGDFSLSQSAVARLVTDIKRKRALKSI
ncbi:MAG TPA: hypothetical protein VN943_15720 [Candidatus Acidoferrum sp.]|nr:hypothetical protein [Candidatus Acidoferrum sp.]